MALRSRRRKIAAAASLLATLAGGATVLATSAQGASPVSTDFNAPYRVSNVEARAEDAMAFAEFYSTSLEEADKMMTAQDLYGTWITAVSESTPEYAASDLDLGSMTARVWFTTIPQSLKVPPLGGLRIELVGGAAITDDQGNARSREVIDALKVAGIEDLYASTDESTGKIKLVAYAGDLAGTTVTKLLPAKITSDPLISIEWATEPVTVPEAVVSGGGRLSTGSGVACTSGFTVREASTGLTGIVTAGHCGNTGMRYNFTSTYFEVMTHKRDHVGVWGDLGWYAVPGDERAEFYAHHNEVRRYVSSAVARNGMLLCNYGRATDRVSVACTRVVDDGADTGFSNDMVRTESDLTQPGDSGGPWYANNTGYGIHYGQINGTSSFTQVHFIDEALGLNTLKG